MERPHNSSIFPFDERRDLIVLQTKEEAIAFAAEHWEHTALRSIQRRGRFAVALSGGSTPKPVYEIICRSKKIDWSKVWLFWSDERAVSPDSSESNYHMVMEAGFQHLSIPKAQIFRMRAEKEIQKGAKMYEEAIHTHLVPSLFDLVLLGLGEDGHTASLFPETQALEETTRLVRENSTPKGERMTLTFPCIQQSSHVTFLIFGKAKASIVREVLGAPLISSWPASRVGTPENKALWILDSEAAQKIFK